MEEKHILFEQVTDMDKNKKNIAWHFAMCHLYDVEYDERALICYNALPLCDQLDIDRQASIICGLKKGSVRRESKVVIKECLKIISPFIIIAIISAILMFYCASHVYDPRDPVSEAAARTISPYSYAYTMDDDILKVLNRANKIVYDYDKNGEVNCVDKAVAFKLVWDQMFSEHHDYKCEIVRNYNKGVMNHLFVRVKYGLGQWIYVEPAYNPAIHLSYEMWDVWGRTYDPLYNIYGETKLWLAKCRR